MLIRRAIPLDSESIAMLFMRVWKISLAEYLPDGFLKRFDFEVQKEKYAMRAKDPNWLLLVATENGKVVGFVGAIDNDSEPLSYQKQIRSLYVDPDCQRQGIGSALFDAISKELRKSGSQSMMLWCIEANIPACSFYKKQGGKLIEGVNPPAEYSEMPHIIYVWSN